METSTSHAPPPVPHLRKTITEEEVTRTVGPVIRVLLANVDVPVVPDMVPLLLAPDSRARDCSHYGTNLEQLILPIEEARRNLGARQVVERLAHDPASLMRRILAISAPSLTDSAWTTHIVPILSLAQAQFDASVAALYLVQLSGCKPHFLYVAAILAWNVPPAGSVSHEEAPAIAMVFELSLALAGAPLEAIGAVVLPWSLMANESEETMPHHRAKHKVAPWRSHMSKACGLRYIGTALVEPRLVEKKAVPATHYDTRILS